MYGAPTTEVTASICQADIPSVNQSPRFVTDREREHQKLAPVLIRLRQSLALTDTSVPACVGQILRS